MKLQPILAANDRNTVYHITVSFATAKPNPVAVNFKGDKLTSDAGVLFLKLAGSKLRFTERINSCIHDPRDPRYATMWHDS